MFLSEKIKGTKSIYLGLESRLHLRSIWRCCVITTKVVEGMSKDWLLTSTTAVSVVLTDPNREAWVVILYQWLAASILNYNTEYFFSFLLCCRIKRGIQSVSQRLKDFKFFVTDYIIQAKLTETILRYILTIIIISIINTMIHFTTAIIINIGIIHTCNNANLIAPAIVKPYILQEPSLRI